MTNTNEVGNQLRLDLLREALPYIQRFKGQTFVVKLSGKATEDQENLSSLAEELALLHQVGIRLCVVHGGGKQLSDLASMMGIKQTIINGRRVTDDATLEMAKMIFAGKINTDILAALRNRGIEAVGLSGVDGNIVHAERRPPKQILNRETGERSEIDFADERIAIGRVLPQRAKGRAVGRRDRAGRDLRPRRRDDAGRDRYRLARCQPALGRDDAGRPHLQLRCLR